MSKAQVSTHKNRAEAEYGDAPLRNHAPLVRGGSILGSVLCSFVTSGRLCSVKPGGQLTGKPLTDFRFNHRCLGVKRCIWQSLTGFGLGRTTKGPGNTDVQSKRENETRKLRGTGAGLPAWTASYIRRATSARTGDTRKPHAAARGGARPPAFAPPRPPNQRLKTLCPLSLKTPIPCPRQTKALSFLTQSAQRKGLQRDAKKRFLMFVALFPSLRASPPRPFPTLCALCG